MPAKKDTTADELAAAAAAKAHAALDAKVAATQAKEQAAAAAEKLRVRTERRTASSAKMMMYLTVAPPPADYVWRGFLRGTVGGLIAAGSTGKSFLAIEAAMCVASPAANSALLKLDIAVHGRVVIINAEDPEQIVWERVYAIGKNMNVADFQAMANNIEVISLFGRPKTDMSDPSFIAEMLGYTHDTRLAVFDTLNRLSGNADENSNGEMALLLKGFEYLAVQANSGVLVLHHSSKAASSNGQQHKQEAARGASSITSNLRWQGYMQCMTEEEAKEMGISVDDRHVYVRFGGNKENYGVRTGDTWLKRHDRGVLLPVDFAAQTEAADAIKKARAGKAAQTKRARAAEYSESLKTTDAQVRRATAAKQAELDKHVDPDAQVDSGFTSAAPYAKAKMAQQKPVKKGRPHGEA